MRYLAKLKLYIIFLGAISGCTMFTDANETQVFSDDSYLGVKIGVSVNEALDKLHGYISTADIGEDEEQVCYHLIPENNAAGATFMVESEEVVRIDVYQESLGITTKLGFGIGSTKKDIMEGYSNVKVEPHPYDYCEGEYLRVKLPNGNGIIFETHKDIVDSFRLGSFPAVGYIEGCL